MSGEKARRIAVISDFCDGDRPLHDDGTVADYADAWLAGLRGPPPAPASAEKQPVVGGYLERLPLAAVRHKLSDVAEIWNFWAHDTAPPFSAGGGLVRRSFRADPSRRPFSSNDLLGHIAAFGAPEILCVWGLGVDEAILRTCGSSIKIYNSIDAPALRVPSEVSGYFDIVLTGADWQSREVADRHPEMMTAVLPIGPEFASPDTFFPLESKKPYDVIYVAAAQAYKRHDVLFEALAKLPRSIRALCVCGYGELGDALRAQAAELGIDVDFVGPPGVDFEQVNRLMNLAKIGVVCGVEDGAPAILTEYMLAGLPVLANAGLKCGLQYITPSTGLAVSEDSFHQGIVDLLASRETLQPRQAALENWAWPRSIETFAALVRKITPRRGLSE